MILYLVPSIAILLITAAMVLEFASRNDARRPFSRHSLNKRRWDDPNYRHRRDAVVPGSISGSGMTLGHERHYRVSKDPAVQARLLAGSG